MTYLEYYSMSAVTSILQNYTNSINKIKQTGEVFTPRTIVTEMESMLLRYEDDIFTKPDLTWCDNSAGIGHIMYYIYLRLMDGLATEITDQEARKKHILEKMLFMYEISQNNVETIKKIFNPDEIYNMNIITGDTLLSPIVARYDVIIGNPPYQKANKKNNKARGGTNNNLYLDFISYSLKCLKPNGLLLFINPSSWRKLNSKIIPELLSQQFIELNLNYGGDLFPTMVKTDMYLVKNTPNTGQAEGFLAAVNCYDKGKLVMSSKIPLEPDLKYIPNMYNTEIRSILKKMSQHGTTKLAICNSDCHKVRPHVNKGKTEKFCYPLYNTSANPDSHYSSRPHKDQTRKKVLMSCSGKLLPKYDPGELGTTQDSMYYLVNSQEEGERLIKWLNSDLYKYIVKICQWGNFRNEPSLFSCLPFPPSDFSGSISNFFQLTTEENAVFTTGRSTRPRPEIKSKVKVTIKQLD